MEQQKKKSKYKAPNTLTELNRQSDLRELADYIIEPKNRVLKAVIIALDRDNNVAVNTTEELSIIDALGMIELAKGVLITDNELSIIKDEDE